jgi:hypothetical protein
MQHHTKRVNPARTKRPISPQRAFSYLERIESHLAGAEIAIEEANARGLELPSVKRRLTLTRRALREPRQSNFTQLRQEQANAAATPVFQVTTVTAENTAQAT